MAGRSFAIIGAVAALIAPDVLAFRDGPPARVTGGFGEDDCSVCHAGQPRDEAAGQLSLSGLPDRITPGAIYELALRLSRPGLKSAGFQLAIRDSEDGTQAGRLAASESSRNRVAVVEDRGVQFAHQSAPELLPGTEGTVHWPFTWTAPTMPGQVAFHAAAVAGNGDDSELDDYVYTLEIRTGE